MTLCSTDDNHTDHAPTLPTSDPPSTPTPTMWADIVEGMRFSAPVTLVVIGQFLSSPLNGAVIARTLGEDAFTGYSLASLSGNLIGLSLVMGMQSACDTLLPIAAGAKRYEDMGDWAVVGTVLSLLLIIFALPMWMNAESILLAIDQPPEAARYAGEYLRIYPGHVLLLGLYESIRRFMSCQNILWPFVVFTYLGLAAQGGCLYVFFGGEKINFVDAAWAQVTNQVVSVGSCLLWVWCAQPHDSRSWPGFRWSAFRWARVKTYLKLAVPGVFTLSEWWYWEVVCFFTGWISEHAQAAHSCAYFVVPMYYLIVLGVGISANIKIGKLIGDGDVKRARALRTAFLVLAMVLSILLVATHFAVQDLQITTLNGTEGEPRDLAYSIWFYVGAFIFMDTQYALHSSMARALGLQIYVAAAVIVSLWIVALPISYYITFSRGMGLKGIWIMFPIGHTLMVTSTMCITYFTNWETVSKKMRKEEACGEETSGVVGAQDGEGDAETGGVELQEVIPQGDEVALVSRSSTPPPLEGW